MKGRGRKLFFCSLLLCTNIVFIWGNSMLSGTVSGQISQTVMEIAGKILSSPLFEKVSVHLIDFFNELLGTTIPNEDVGQHLLRKMAHFTEFCWLGVTLTWFFLILEQKGIHSFAMPLLGGMTVACIDETIQLYTPGRAASLVDVWIDVCGVVIGIMILLIGHYVITFRKRRKKVISEETT